MCSQTRNSCAKAFDYQSRSKNLKPKKIEGGGVNLTPPPLFKASRVNNQCNKHNTLLRLSQILRVLTKKRSALGLWQICERDFIVLLIKNLLSFLHTVQYPLGHKVLQ